MERSCANAVETMNQYSQNRCGSAHEASERCLSVFAGKGCTRSFGKGRKISSSACWTRLLSTQSADQGKPRAFSMPCGWNDVCFLPGHADERDAKDTLPRRVDGVLKGPSCRRYRFGRRAS